MEGLFKIAKEEFYFDIDKISDYIRIDGSVDQLFQKPLLVENEEDGENEVGQQDHQLIDVAKWEIIKAMTDTVLNENGVIDESMGITKLGDQLSIPFRLAFNTLLKHKIIKKNG